MPKTASESPLPPHQELVPASKPSTSSVALAPPQNTGEVMALFAHLAQQPNLNVDTLERLMAMHERLIAQQAVERFAVAMQAAQAEMRPISADATNPQTRSKYASYNKLDLALRRIYTAHGFAVSYDTAKSEKPEHMLVLAYVSHAGGHVRTHQVEMPNDGKGAKGGDVMTKTHATGAAMTYGMRYLLKMIFNVAVGEDDTDGNTPGQERRPAQQTARRPSHVKNADSSVQVLNVRKIEGVSKSKKKDGKEIGCKPYVLSYIKFSDGKEIGTFDTKIAELAEKAHADGANVVYDTQTSPAGNVSLATLEVKKEINEEEGFSAPLPGEGYEQLAQTPGREPGDELPEDV
ncbi:MAG TPA: ERF family protein, partial [Thermoanaerobaculia bacterium]|nr:ERF family protein [Thermoanaerobaculia bacterium]